MMKGHSPKHQIPSTKLQRSSKNEAPIASVRYPGHSRHDCELKLNEGSDGAHSDRHPFDLEERTALFGEAVIRFRKKVPRGPDNDRLISQLVGCSTSIGANYCEANEGVSKKDFRNTIGRCVKEAKETKFFLRMIAASEPALAGEARKLYREAKELHLIFASMFRK
jgi:four helix bundle protein